MRKCALGIIVMQSPKIVQHRLAVNESSRNWKERWTADEGSIMMREWQMKCRVRQGDLEC